jgi:hypothetical protein
MSKEKPQLPIKLTYRFDSFLMYLVQDITKRPTIEIINFFHELSTQVAEIGQKNRTGRGIHKKIDDYFPGTSIPFYLELKGHPNHHRTWDPVTRTYKDAERETFNCHVQVSFPDRPTYMDSKIFEEIGDFLMEKALLGVEVPADSPANAPFVRPETSSPKMYKDLMDLYAGRPVEDKPKRKKKTEA